MQVGFEVVLEKGKKADFDLFNTEKSLEKSLISFTKDNVTGDTLTLIGKLYYKNELKTRLPQKIREKYTTDADLALAIFQHYGYQGLTWLEGEFALVLFNAKEHYLLAMRDPIGSWPLYWACQNEIVRVSTSLRLLSQKLQHTVINCNFLAEFLIFPFPSLERSSEETAFEKISRILPGTFLVLYSNGRSILTKYWDWMESNQCLENIELEEASFQFLQLFRQAIKERVQCGQVASDLSGGMDSSSIVCLTRNMFSSKTIPYKLKTLSLVYQLPSLAGEKSFIKMVVDQDELIEPHYIDGDNALAFQWFTTQIPIHDEPYSGLFYFAMEKILIDKAIQLGVSTALSGIGAELLVEGNRFFLADLLHDSLWSECIKEARQLSNVQNVSLWSILFEFALKPFLPAILRGGIGKLFHQGYRHWTKLGDFDIPPWLISDFAQKYNLSGKAQETMRQISHYPVEKSFNQLQLQTSVGNWPSWYLGAPLGLRISHPFLDPRLISYCLNLPRKVKVIPGVKKPILQFAMRGILPEPIRTRRFQSSFNEVYWKGLSQNLPYLEKMVRHSQIDEFNIFDKQQLLEIMRQYAVGIGDAKIGVRINSSLALIFWFEQIKNEL